jgi:hypothetical protein
MIIGRIGSENMGGWTPVYMAGSKEDFEILYWAFNNMSEETMAAIKAVTVDARIQESLDACKKTLEKLKLIE